MVEENPECVVCGGLKRSVVREEIAEMVFEVENDPVNKIPLPRTVAQIMEVVSKLELSEEYFCNCRIGENVS